MSNAVINGIGASYTLETYTEHALEVASSAKAASYVGIKDGSGRLFWGAGISSDINRVINQGTCQCGEQAPGEE